MDPTSSYEFASDPRAVAPARARYRPEASAGSLAEGSSATLGHAPNIMQDPRVWRGSTYAGSAGGHKHASLATKEATMAAPGTMGASGTLGGSMGGRTRRRKKGGRTGGGIYDIRPAARRHIEVSLEEHLIAPEEVIAEVEVTTQTDVFEERPETPSYVPKKTGVDVATQILPDDLFNFDREVDPILDIIVGKTLEQALLEVEEEEELTNIEGRKQTLIEGKRQESVRIRDMEEVAIREFEAKEKRKKRAIEVKRAQDQARRKVAAVSAGHDLALLAVNSALGALHREGKFSNPLQDEVENTFMPWLLDRVDTRLQSIAVANACREVAVGLAVARGAELVAAEKARLAAIEAERRRLEEEERRTYVRVFVKVVVGEGDEAAEVMAGPIRVKRAFTVSEVETAIQQWLTDNPVSEEFTVPAGSLNLTYGGARLEKERSLLDQALPDDAALEIGDDPPPVEEGGEEDA